VDIGVLPLTPESKLRGTWFPVTSDRNAQQKGKSRIRAETYQKDMELQDKNENWVVITNAYYHMVGLSAGVYLPEKVQQVLEYIMYLNGI
jgi:hypothetical protein